jgi:transcriptional regulator with XRE-family HTH domain
VPTFPSSSVEEARKAIASRLTDLRRDAGLTKRAVAEAAGWHPSKSTRLESGATRPSDDDIRAWCRICGADDQAADLVAASRSADSMYIEWRRVQRTGMRRFQEARVPLYERTKTFHVYCSNVIPGFLQTPAYATSLLTRFSEFHGTPNDVRDAVAARIERSRILQHGEHRFAMLIEESVLRYRIGDSDTMAGQLGHLLAVMFLPSVSLGVIPFAASRTLWPVETFNIFDGEMVAVELLSAAVTINAPSQVKQYLAAFEQLAGMAIYGPAARMVITAAIEALD